MNIVRHLSLLVAVPLILAGCGTKNNEANVVANNVADSGSTGDSGTVDNNETDMGGADSAGDGGVDAGEREPFAMDCDFSIWPSADARTNFEAIQNALLDVPDGGVVCIGDGEYSLEEELSLDVPNVEVRGESKEGTVLNFAGQTEGANGLSATGDGVLFNSFTVRNTPGDAIRVTGANGVTFRDLNVTWSGGPQGENGAYGLYPVQCQNVLIEGSTVSYASDAGIYVGQSMNVIVRNNEAFGNVAGIEIENTTGADVYDNHAHDNTGGLLVFDLPGPPIQGGNSNKIHDNVIENNNEPNFAEPGNIVGLVPAGTGVLVISSDRNEFHNNTITNNQSIGVAIVSFQTTGQPYDFNPEFDPYAEGNWVHDNTFDGNGGTPSGFVSLVSSAANISRLEPLTWDGVADAAKDNTDGSLTNCFSNNTENGAAAGFRNFNTDEGFANQSTDITPNDCTHTALPATMLDE